MDVRPAGTSEANTVQQGGLDLIGLVQAEE